MQPKSAMQKELQQALVKLLQGFVFKDDVRTWTALLVNQSAVRDYFQKIGLFVHIDELDGYAFLKSSPEPEEEGQEPSTTGSPLMRRMPLSFEVTLLLVLLREALMQFDESSRDDHRLILSRSEIYDMLKIFFKDRSDETKLIRRFDSLIAKAIEMQVISELRSEPDKIEVNRVIRAMVDSQRLMEIKAALAGHAQHELRE